MGSDKYDVFSEGSSVLPCVCLRFLALDLVMTLMCCITLMCCVLKYVGFGGLSCFPLQVPSVQRQ